ncbi:MAG: radical SAM family heme chaperone HemW [Bacteroidales bacterium]|nr:radical SAM family heme chaperone HemW [Bacteroidales bacterium]
MSGIYIHIPFCKSKCSYCDFYSVANSKKVEDFISALLKEIEIRKDHLSDKNIETIYFGGGTPSQLDVRDIEIIINELTKHYRIEPTAEISFEANPDDLNINYLQELKYIGINRLSIGLQSLDDDILKFLRRRHTAEVAIESVENANKYGFDNISVDLIYGIPGLSEKMWQETLHKTFKLPIEHLSAYHLGIEKNTLMYRQLKENKFQIIEEESSYRQYCDLLVISSSYGINQYEISNLAKSKYKSKHNSSYWQRTEYLGFGPSAHSYYQNQRAFNVSDINLYCEKIIRSEEHYQTEILSITDQMNETIMLSLRTVEGLNIENFENNFGEKQTNRLKSNLKSIESSNYNLEDGFIRLTPKGMFVSDDIISELFV